MFKSIPAEPAERCPNCRKWYKMGHCNHTSSAGLGTLYGVCSNCAEAHERFAKMMEETE